MKDYNLGIIQPGESKPVNVVGNYIRNIGQGSIKVSALNNKISVKAFDTVIGAGGSRSPVDVYTTWQVENNTAVAIAVSVLIGEGEATESEISISADVNSITEPRNLSANGNQYTGAITHQPAGIPNMQLWNPVGSIKDLNVFLINGSSATVPLLSICGWTNTGLSTPSTILPINKNTGLNDSVAELRFEEVATLGPKVISTRYMNQYSKSYGRFQLGANFFEGQKGRGLIIEPGQGIIVNHPATTGGSHDSHWEWEEVTI